MSKKPQRPPGKHEDPEQSKRFIDAAKEAEADETEAAADRAFKRVAPNPVKPKH